MKIEGIGTIKKSEAMSILTAEGRKAVKDGEITAEELGAMYKLELVKKASKVGSFGESFRMAYQWIPESLKEKLTPEELAELTDRFSNCYAEGKKKGEA